MTKRSRIALLFAVLSLAAAQQIPRPEYPQPQFEREHWLNLNGQWEFEFDDANRGLTEDWAETGKAFSRHITVPFCFESAKSGIRHLVSPLGLVPAQLLNPRGLEKPSRAAAFRRGGLSLHGMG